MKSTRLLLRLGVRLTSIQQINVSSHKHNFSKMLMCDKTIRRAFVHSDAKPEESQNVEVEKKKLGTLEKKLKLAFTCLKCQTRNYKIISKQAYEKGVVIARCDGCRNNHLIADNLNWFPAKGEWKNIELILKAKGEKVRRIRNDEEGYFEALEEMELEEKARKSNANARVESDADTMATPQSDNINRITNSSNEPQSEVQHGKVDESKKS